MLVHIDQDKIADYFPVPSCSWAMGQHCTGYFLVQFGTSRSRQYCIDYFAPKTSRPRPTLHKIFFGAMLSQTYLDNIE